MMQVRRVDAVAVLAARMLSDYRVVLRTDGEDWVISVAKDSSVARRSVRCVSAPECEASLLEDTELAEDVARAVRLELES